MLACYLKSKIQELELVHYYTELTSVLTACLPQWLPNHLGFRLSGGLMLRM